MYVCICMCGGAVLAVNPRLLAPLFVSERHKDKGIYTLKLFKAGQVGRRSSS